MAETILTRLEQIDPATRKRRYYELSLTRSLFGDVALVRRWGRIGRAGGVVRIELHGDARAARRALRHWCTVKERRGYRRVRA